MQQRDALISREAPAVATLACVQLMLRTCGHSTSESPCTRLYYPLGAAWLRSVKVPTSFHL